MDVESSRDYSSSSTEESQKRKRSKDKKRKKEKKEKSHKVKKSKRSKSEKKQKSREKDKERGPVQLSKVRVPAQCSVGARSCCGWTSRDQLKGWRSCHHERRSAPEYSCSMVLAMEISLRARCPCLQHLAGDGEQYSVISGKKV